MRNCGELRTELRRIARAATVGGADDARLLEQVRLDATRRHVVLAVEVDGAPLAEAARVVVVNRLRVAERLEHDPALEALFGHRAARAGDLGEARHRHLRRLRLPRAALARDQDRLRLPRAHHPGEGGGGDPEDVRRQVVLLELVEGRERLARAHAHRLVRIDDDEHRPDRREDVVARVPQPQRVQHRRVAHVLERDEVVARHRELARREAQLRERLLRDHQLLVDARRRVQPRQLHVRA